VVNWLHSLSILSLLLVTCAATAVVTVAIYVILTRLAAAGQRDALSAVSPGLLPPLALVFGLLIGFLAAGVWSGPLSKKLGAPMPIRPGKGYSIDYRPAPIRLRTSLTLEDARVAVTPLDGMLRLAGTMEFGGFDESVNPTRVAGIRRAAQENLVGWDNPPGEAAPWAGLRPNAYIASGHGMLGLALAPGTAEIITDLITTHSDRMPPEVSAAVSPDRFLGSRAGRWDSLMARPKEWL